MQINNLPIAVRVFPEVTTSSEREPKNRGRVWTRPDAMFIFDTETRTDVSQRLTFGSYRLIENHSLIEEGLFAADDLTEEESATLNDYAAANKLKLLSRAQFVERLYVAAYKCRCLIVGFNLPFDFSRVAFDFSNARGRFAGGFSLGLWSYKKDGRECRDQYRPRIGIKHIDSKRALKGFTARNSPDHTDLIPEGSTTQKAEKGYVFRGHFLELRTLAFALTDRGHSLESACEAFGVEHGKQKVKKHGIITEEYIDYNRRDVLATYELACKLLEEYDLHPIDLQPTKAYSPASVGKAYLRAMGITPVLKRQSDFPKQLLGYAQSAFFGGRTSAHIRKIPVPVVYTDFLSMYPTVNSLMNLWEFVTAQQIVIENHCAKGIERLLSALKPSDLFDPALWRMLPAFVQMVPNGDILPVRARYGAITHDWQVGINHLYTRHTQEEALWFSLPDVVASVILTGRVPKIIDAFRLKPDGRLTDMRSVRLRGSVEIDPRDRDFFRVVIQERNRIKSSAEVLAAEEERTEGSLKVTANSASYGIYAEMNRQESDEAVRMTCYGIDPLPFGCTVSHPENPGAYCFPPFASLITGAARLMLALLEHTVTELGGTYAMEDTDSMAILATKHGGLVLCPGGPHRLPDGREGVKALSWSEVESVRQRFAALNPYDREIVPGSVLKLEKENFYKKTTRQRPLYCLAISAKRYSLFVLDNGGTPEIVRFSEHGLGHLLNPTDPESEDRDWIRQIWDYIVRKSLGLPAEMPAFAALPAVGRTTVSSPAVMKTFSDFNRDKPYRDQIKPFNFILTCQTAPFGHPIGADRQRFHLIGPYTPDSRQWLRMKWIDQYSEPGHREYRITTSGYYGTADTARVKTYGDVITEYEYHPESKCADAEGNECDKQTIGLLRRPHVGIDLIKFIGKESNSLEEVESGMVQDADAVYTEYVDERRDEWITKIVPRLKKIPLAVLVEKSGLSRRALIDIRAARSRPHPANQKRLAAIARQQSRTI
jgi:hypothetical protein